MSKTETVNKEYYDKLYRKRGWLQQLIYPYVSYDQQCKAKYNIRLIMEVIRSSGNAKDFRYMDYGFGHGSLILKLPQRENLYGCDISIEAVKNFPDVAKRMGKSVITCLPEDLETMISGIRFDLISLSHIIEHVENDYQLLQHLSTFLQPNGKFLINVPINEVWIDPKHVRKYDLGYMEGLAERCNLKIRTAKEVEKWSGFFGTYQNARKTNKVIVMGIRFMRLIMAILPLPVVKLSESIFLSRYRFQQLVLILERKTLQ